MQTASPTAVSLKISSLTKHYGKVKAVQALDLEIGKGTVYGILGPNGSGKTTTLGMVLGVTQPTSGNFEWFGQPPSNQHLKRIGAILENPIFYPYLTGVANLKIVADIKGISYDKIPGVLDQVGLSERGKSKFKTYSLGMKQRLAIGAALLGNPEVLILDEPTNGLDPEGIADIRTMIREIGDSGITIILASHLLDEVEKVCSHVAVLRRGQLLFSGPVNDVLTKEPEVQIASNDMEALENLLRDWPLVQTIRKDNGHLFITGKESIPPEMLNQYVFDQGMVLSHLSLKKTTLEESFLELLAQTPTT